MRKFFVILAVILLMAGCNKPLRVAVLGDSYSTFKEFIPEGNAVWYPQEVKNNDVTDVHQTWWQMLADSLGVSIVLNESYSGSTICNTGYNGEDYSDRSFITRMPHIVEAAPDVLIIFGGTNDSWANAPLGELKYSDWTDEELYSTFPAFCKMLDYLTTALPDTKIINLLNTELKPEIGEAMAIACEHYGVQHVVLQDIDKQWGHPSQAGMASIFRQVRGLGL